MIENARKEMLPQLCELWKQCFGDDIDYSNNFFAHHLVGDSVYQNQFIIQKDEKIVSMLTVLEATIQDGQDAKPFWYIYGVATHEEYRKQGYAGMILKHVMSLAKKDNVAVGLVPANQNLFSYYEKLGFYSFFYQRRYSEILENKEDNINDAFQLVPIEAARYKQLREKAFRKDGYVQWGEKAIEYAINENRNSGGKALEVVCGSESHFLLCCPYQEQLIIRETDLSLKYAKEIGGRIAREFGLKQIIIVLTPLQGKEQENKCNGMMWNYKSIQNMPYIGLTLD